MSRDLSLLHPKLRVVLPRIKADAAAQGLPVLWTDGLRTEAEQNALYAQGRTAPGVIVTSVRYPNSMHNWGVAVDFCRNVKGREYDDTDNFFARVAYIAKAYGLEWGGDWKSFVDKPHLQLAEYSLDGTTAYLRQTYGTPEKFFKAWPDKEPEPPVTTAGFADVPADRWSADAIVWCKDHGIMAGYDDGTFRPQQAVTREELASIAFRMAALFGKGE